MTAGTVNYEGPVTVRATSTGADATLASIARLVADAQVCSVYKCMLLTTVACTAWRAQHPPRVQEEATVAFRVETSLGSPSVPALSSILSCVLAFRSVCHVLCKVGRS